MRPGRNTAALESARPLPLLSKYPATTTPFGVVLAESRLPAEDFHETVEEHLGSQACRADPIVGIEDRAEIDGQKSADNRGAEHQVAPANGDAAPARAALTGLGHQSFSLASASRAYTLSSRRSVNSTQTGQAVRAPLEDCPVPHNKVRSRRTGSIKS